MKIIGNPGNNLTANFTTPQDLKLDLDLLMKEVGTLLDMESFEAVKLTVIVKIEGLSTTPGGEHTLTFSPYLFEGAIVKFYYPVITKTLPLKDEGIVSFDLDFSIQNTTDDLRITLSDDVSDDITVQASVFTYGDIPGGGVDVSTVGGEEPMTEEDIAGVILDDPDTPIKNSSSGKVSTTGGSVYDK